MHRNLPLIITSWAPGGHPGTGPAERVAAVVAINGASSSVIRCVQYLIGSGAGVLLSLVLRKAEWVMFRSTERFILIIKDMIEFLA
jgi:hypothetical protein